MSLYTRQKNPTFTCENQRRLLQEVLQAERESVLAILPTGSGKSLAIFGPTLNETAGVSVVITPFTALRRQLAEQARAFGIKLLVWSDRKSEGSLSPLSARLVIMITDDVYTDDAKM